MLDEFDAQGALRADFQQFYGLDIDDVWTGALSPSHAYILAQHLKRNPHSRVFAIHGGTPELQGWDAAAIIAARKHNLIAALFQGFSKDKSRDIFIDYPTAPEQVHSTYRPATLAELTDGHVNNFMYG